MNRFIKVSLLVLVISSIPLLLFMNGTWNEFSTKLSCKEPEQMVVHLGVARNPVCVDVFPDGGNACSVGSECQGGYCEITYQNREYVLGLVDEQVESSGWIPRYSLKELPNQPIGKCRRNSIPVLWDSTMVIDDQNILLNGENVHID